MMVRYFRVMPYTQWLLLCTAVAIASSTVFSPATAEPKPDTWHCQAETRLTCNSWYCWTTPDRAVSITLNRTTGEMEICLYSQCLTGMVAKTPGIAIAIEHFWIRARSKPEYPNPVTIVLALQMDRQHNRFVLARPGGTSHLGSCRPLVQ